MNSYIWLELFSSIEFLEEFILRIYN